MKTTHFLKLHYFMRFAVALVALVTLAQTVQGGSIQRLIYYDANGTVSNFVSLAAFPNSPSFQEQLDDFSPYYPNFGLQSKSDSQYYPKLFGSYTRGYLEAPTNGNYIFFIASYNDSQLWLSTNLAVAGKQLIAYETNRGTALFTGARLNTRQSTNIALVGGQKYYLEIIHQGNSASNSYVQVGWQRPDGVQEIIPTLHLAQYEYNPFRGTYTVPTLNSYGFNGGDLLSSVATNEGSVLILQADVLATQPTGFRWFRNGVQVPGANLSYLQFSPVYAADNGASFQFVITNAYGSLTSSPSVLSITPDTTPPAVTLVETRGNPNGVRVTYSKPVSLSTALNLSNYALQIQGGSSLVVTQATLLPGQQTVQLAGAFNFHVGVTYQLTVSGIQDLDTTPNTLSPNPTTATFVYAPVAGTLYTFNDGSTNGFSLYGPAYLAAGGSYDNSGFADLTDASQYQAGVILFSNKSTVQQFHLNFKTRISGASAIPGDGFSVNLAADLPPGTYFDEQKGYVPPASPTASRLVVAFDNDRLVNGVVLPAITVKWQGNVVTNIQTGTGGVPGINSTDGHWANVDLQLVPGGNLSLSYDGVLIFTNLATGFVPVPAAQLEIAAQTGVNSETHWFDDVYISYTDGGIGPVGFANNPSLTNITVLENQTATFAVIPSGAAPYTYQWYYNGSAIAAATNSGLSVLGKPGTGGSGTAGSYAVVLSNEFSQTNSATATLTVTPDTTPPQLLSARILAFGNNQVVLTFNKPLDPTTATSLATYNLGLLALYSATLSADGQTVTLTTGTLERNQVYLFTITGLKDATAAANSLTTTGSFVATVAGVADYAAQIINDGAVRYWRFDEGVSGLTVASLVTSADPISSGVVPLSGSPTLGATSLIPAEPQDTAIGLSSATSDYLVVPNGADINTAGPYAQKTVELWFNASSLPAPGQTGLTAANTLFEEGAATRGVALYLWRDPANANPDVAQLIFHAWNNASDGPGSPWGATSPLTTTPVYAQTTVQAGQTYHVVAVLNGDSVSTNGQLILYVNGAPVSTVSGVGQLYAHTSDIEIGRGGTLLHDGSSGTTASFSGVIDDLSLYNVALSSNLVALHYEAGTNAANLLVTNPAPLAVSRLDTLGNPNSLVLTFNQPVSKTTATNRANYVLKNAAGTSIVITNATLLGGASSVQLLGSFGFLVGSNYTLTVANITNSSLTSTVTPNPTNLAFGYNASAGTTYSFNSGLPVGVQVAGKAYVTNSGSYDGSGFVDVTDAATNQNGAVVFTDRHDITQAHIRFKARLSNGSTPAGAGFSVNIAPDLPAATFSKPEAGYLVTPLTNRLSVSFNNLSNAPPSISVLWYGVNLTNVLTGVGGIPALNNTDGHWANVDINLLISGLLSVGYDGVTVITNLATGFQPVLGGQVGIAADTTASVYETHWFDDINLNFADGLVGPVTIPSSGQPQSIIGLENHVVTVGVAPAGYAPFGYQWYFTNAPLAGATNRTLGVNVTTNTIGAYKVVVRNNFSSATSSPAIVSIQLDQNPAAVTNIAAYGGGVNQVQVQFNKQLDPVTATNPTTYTINTLGINAVTLSSNGTLVTLFTGQQQNLQTNKLYITGLLDYAAQPHVLNTNVTFQSGVSYYQETLVDSPVRYYRLDETNGTVVNSDVSVLDPLSTAQGTTFNKPVLGVPALFTNSTGTAIQFNNANTNYITFTAKEYDVTWTNTGAPHTFPQRSVEFWFKANSLPYAGYYTDTNGNQQVTNHAYGLWSEGATARYFVVYLYGTDNTTTSPSQAWLYVNGGNIANDGPGAFQQWGTLSGGGPAFAVYARALITTGQVYHVVAQLNGIADTNTATLGDPLGDILLYTNGALADVSENENSNPAGLLYGHSGTTIRVGQGGTNFRHDGYSFSSQDTFDGVIDDITVYNSLLSSNRIAAHFQAALTPPLVVVPSVVANTNPPVFGSFSVLGGGLNVTWTNTSAQLQRSTNVNGPFITITNAVSPYHEPATNARVFFRLFQ